MTAGWAFPVSSDDAGRYLIASRTHADIFLDRPVRVAQTENAARTPAGIDRWLPAGCPGSTPAPAGI